MFAWQVIPVGQGMAGLHEMVHWPSVHASGLLPSTGAGQSPSSMHGGEQVSDDAPHVDSATGQSPAV
jgi:hypothetical protein